MRLELQARLLRTRVQSRGMHSTSRLVFFYAAQFLRHSTPRKLVNALLAKAQKGLRRDRVWGMPYRYTIDPVNICNLRCPLCPTGLGTLGRERGRMPLENFTRIIDQIAPYAYLVELYNWGEPFLHPQIFQIIRYASANKIAVRMSSNLNHLTREMAVQTVESGLDALIVSVDGATQSTYEKYRRGGNLQKVLSHVEMLVEEKKKAHRRTPFITLRMLPSRYNESEMNQLRSMAKKLEVDAFGVGSLFVDVTNPAMVKEWLPQDEALSFYDYSAKNPENLWDCSDLWESMTINWDGGLAPCCWLHDKKNDYENAFARPLKEIWNGEAYISSRRVFARGGPKSGPITTACTQCRGRPRYLKA